MGNIWVPVTWHPLSIVCPVFKCKFLVNPLVYSPSRLGFNETKILSRFNLFLIFVLFSDSPLIKLWSFHSTYTRWSPLSIVITKNAGTEETWGYFSNKHFLLVQIELPKNNLFFVNFLHCYFKKLPVVTYTAETLLCGRPPTVNWGVFVL